MDLVERAGVRSNGTKWENLGHEHLRAADSRGKGLKQRPFGMHLAGALELVAPSAGRRPLHFAGLASFRLDSREDALHKPPHQRVSRAYLTVWGGS